VVLVRSSQQLLIPSAKRKREEDLEKQEKIKNGINKYFTANAALAAPKPKVKVKDLRRRQAQLS